MVKEMFLIAGEITYQMADSGSTSFKRLNAVISRPVGHAVIKGEDLIYMTNALAENFHEYMGKEGYAKDAYFIADTVILSIMDMGIQEADEFMPADEGEDKKEGEEVQQ